jgi:hypothetical protein
MATVSAIIVAKIRSIAMAKIDKETLRTMIKKGDYGFYMTKEDFYNAGDKLGAYVSRAMNWDAMFDYLYDNVDYPKFSQCLIDLANDRLKERQIDAKKGFDLATEEMITKLNTFIAVLQGKEPIAKVKATKERGVTAWEREIVEVTPTQPPSNLTEAKPYPLKLAIPLKDDHKFLQALAAGIIKKQLGDDLSRDIQLEWEIRTPKGIIFRADVYTEVRRGIPIIAEIAPYIHDQDQAFGFLRLCNEIRPHEAYFVCYEIGAGFRAIFEHDTYQARTLAGKDTQYHITVVEKAELVKWFEELKPYIRYEPPSLVLEL